LGAVSSFPGGTLNAKDEICSILYKNIMLITETRADAYVNSLQKNLRKSLPVRVALIELSKRAWDIFSAKGTMFKDRLERAEEECF
jgi:hypothetical protein